jgi:hypothetical protein
VENSTVDQNLVKKVKKFCDEWHRGNIYGNRQSFKLAQKYLDQLRDWKIGTSDDLKTGKSGMLKFNVDPETMFVKV